MMVSLCYTVLYFMSFFLGLGENYFNMIETQIEAFCLHNTTTFPSLNLLTFPNLSGFHKALPLPVLSASLWHCRPIAWKLLLLFLMKRERGRCDQNSQKAMRPCQTCKVSTSVFVQSQDNAGPGSSYFSPPTTHHPPLSSTNPKAKVSRANI